MGWVRRTKRVVNAVRRCALLSVKSRHISDRRRKETISCLTFRGVLSQLHVISSFYQQRRIKHQNFTSITATALLTHLTDIRPTENNT